jgi:hypothetical protein
VAAVMHIESHQIRSLAAHPTHVLLLEAARRCTHVNPLSFIMRTGVPAQAIDAAKRHTKEHCAKWYWPNAHVQRRCALPKRSFLPSLSLINLLGVLHHFSVVHGYVTATLYIYTYLFDQCIHNGSLARWNGITKRFASNVLEGLKVSCKPVTA